MSQFNCPSDHKEKSIFHREEKEFAITLLGSDYFPNIGPCRYIIIEVIGYSFNTESLELPDKLIKSVQVFE